MKKTICSTIFSLTIVTIIFGTIYVSVQQVVRIGANDPQIQMAEDTAQKLSFGSLPADFMASDRSQIDISKSLAPFVAIFDENGILMESTAKLHDNIIALPIGVFDYAKKYGQDRFTWQPEKAVRSAVVLKYYEGTSSGFVLAGRSLREIEIRENDLLILVSFGWLVSVLVILCFVFWYNKTYNLNQKQNGK